MPTDLESKVPTLTRCIDLNQCDPAKRREPRLQIRGCPTNLLRLRSNSKNWQIQSRANHPLVHAVPEFICLLLPGNSAVCYRRRRSRVHMGNIGYITGVSTIMERQCRFSISDT